MQQIYVPIIIIIYTMDAVEYTSALVAYVA